MLYAPDYSPDGEWITFVRNGGTNNNLSLMRADGSAVRDLTQIADGTQLYSPRFSPDGGRIALSVARQGQRDIAILKLRREGEELRADDAWEWTVTTEGTDRDPAWSADGKYLYFSSDISDVFNIYAVELETGAVRQITNVRGGAFNPTVDAEGVVCFSAYTADGFEIRQIRDEGPDVVLVQEPRSASSTSVKRPALLPAPKAEPMGLTSSKRRCCRVSV